MREAAAVVPDGGEPLLLYTELAAWWPLLSAPADYAEEAAFYAGALVESCTHPPATLLELGSGGGNNAMHVKEHFERVTLVDLSPGMLEVSRALNPECEHRVGDMRSVRLGESFDCVFVHDAICYAATEADLERVLRTAWEHCRSGGAALFAPDYVRETFRPSTGHGGHDGPDRSLRYLEWTWDPDPDDSWYLADYALLLREGTDPPTVRHDRHVEGLFPIRHWFHALDRVGFVPRSITFRHSGGTAGSIVFLGLRRD